MGELIVDEFANGDLEQEGQTLENLSQTFQN